MFLFAHGGWGQAERCVALLIAIFLFSLLLKFSFNLFPALAERRHKVAGVCVKMICEGVKVI
jgi:hypothetical protein